MAFKTKKQKKYQAFVSHIESVAADLYSQAEWDNARKETEGLGMTLLDMQTTVYDKAFETKPETFNGIQWINSDFGIPAWVRPGVEWSPSDD